jgi:anti-sigma regulatory factor (Ser/Thr protein kinase)
MSAAPDTLELIPDEQALPQALQWIEGIAEREGWPARAAFALTLCLDEALTNIVSYAFDAPADAPAVALSCRRAGPEIQLELRDNGRPYDPTVAEPPALAASLDDAEIGGHGVRLMRHYLQDFAYRREGDWNCLTMTLAA